MLRIPELDNHPDWVVAGEKWGQTLGIIVKRDIVEHRAIIYKNIVTGETRSAELPEGRSGTVIVGNSLKVFVASLRYCGHVSYERINGFVRELAGISLSDSTLVNIVKDIENSTVLFLFSEASERALLASPAANFDETGISVSGKNFWGHVRASPEFTFYNLHEKRGGDAMDDIGFLPKFKGIGIHDCFAPYFKYGMIHALCNAHLLRENDCAEEMGHEWAGKMSELLLDLNLLTDCHGGMLPPRLREWAVKEYRKITAEGMAATGGEVLARPVGQVGKRGRIAKPKYRNLLERYIKYEDAVLRFTTDVNVPFTNNDAERPIRAI